MTPRRYSRTRAEWQPKGLLLGVTQARFSSIVTGDRNWIVLWQKLKIASRSVCPRCLWLMALLLDDSFTLRSTLWASLGVRPCGEQLLGLVWWSHILALCPPHSGLRGVAQSSLNSCFTVLQSITAVFSLPPFHLSLPFGVRFILLPWIGLMKWLLPMFTSSLLSSFKHWESSKDKKQS